MTVLSDLIAEIGTQLPTGVSHEITAAKVRKVLIDMVTQLVANQGSGGGGGGTAERYLTSSTTAAPGDVCYCNTLAGGFTVSLPTGPIPGTGVGFRDAESSWTASNLSVSPGSNKIEGSTGNLICDVTNGNFDLVWSGGPDGWELIPAISSSGDAGLGGAGVGYFHISANQPVAVGGTYYCDTAGGPFTVTLPPSPTVGNGMSFKDASGQWGVSNLILNPGSNPINGMSSSFAIDQADINFDLVWRGLPIGWQVEVPVDDAVRGAGGIDRLRAVQTLAGLTQTMAGTIVSSSITWSPSDKVANIVLSNGNLTATATATVDGGVRATVAGGTGRYFEVTWSTAGTTYGIGLATAAQSLTAHPGGANSVGFFANSYTEWPGSGPSSSGTSWGAGDVIGILLGAANAKLYKNGTLAFTVNTLPSGPLYPMLWGPNAGDAATANFGATTLAFLPPGATSWNGAQTASAVTSWNPNDEFGVTLSNGNLTATGIGTAGGQVRCTKSAGAEHYFEVHIDASGTSGSVYVGLATAAQSLTSGYAGNPNGVSYFNSGYVEWPGGTSNIATYAAGDTIGVRLMSNAVRFYKNGTYLTSASIPSGALFPIAGVFSSACAVTADFGATAFQSLPSGPVAWNS